MGVADQASMTLFPAPFFCHSTCISVAFNGVAESDIGVVTKFRFTVNEIVLPAEVTFEIFKPPALPFCKNPDGLVASVIVVRPDSAEKNAVFVFPLMVIVPSGR